MKMLTRAGRATILDRNVFTEAFFDDDGPADAAIVVAGVGAVSHVGLVFLHGLGFGVAGLFSAVLGAVIGWLILAFATWFTATRLFQASTRPQTMMALQGLAALPLLVETLAAPHAAASLLASMAGGLALVWYLVVLVVATQQATDLSTRKSAASVLMGFAAAVLLRALIGVPFALLGGLFG